MWHGEKGLWPYQHSDPWCPTVVLSQFNGIDSSQFNFLMPESRRRQLWAWNQKHCSFLLFDEQTPCPCYLINTTNIATITRLRELGHFDFHGQPPSSIGSAIVSLDGPLHTLTRITIVFAELYYPFVISLSVLYFCGSFSFGIWRIKFVWDFLLMLGIHLFSGCCFVPPPPPPNKQDKK